MSAQLPGAESSFLSATSRSNEFASSEAAASRWKKNARSDRKDRRDHEVRCRWRSDDRAQVGQEDTAEDCRGAQEARHPGVPRYRGSTPQADALFAPGQSQEDQLGIQQGSQPAV